MEQTIRQRIRILIDTYSKNVNAFALKTGVNQRALSHMFQRNTEPSVKTISAILKAFPEINEQWLISGRGEMQKEIAVRPFKTNEKYSDSLIPLYNIEAAANLNTIFVNPDQNILGVINIPNIPKCDGAVYVRGDSMFPVLKSGDIIMFRNIRVSMENIIYGGIYLVDLVLDDDDYITVKYVKHSEKGETWN